MKLKRVIFVWVIVFFVLSGQLFAQKYSGHVSVFLKAVEKNLKREHKTSLSKICSIETDLVARRIFSEYGAIFLAENNVLLPNKCIFGDELEVKSFQAKVTEKTVNFGDVVIQLQEPAMNALLAAQAEAAEKNLKITPRGGSSAAKRSYLDTLVFWNSRFYPALDYWLAKEKLSQQDVFDLRSLPIHKQIAQVLEWEKDGLYFNTDFTKSILYSVAAPGTSQHLSMLALDVEQYSDLEVRNILAKHGWFQTVKSDYPHFTYLGIDERNLFNLGLRPVLINGYKFWLTDLDVP